MEQLYRRCRYYVRMYVLQLHWKCIINEYFSSPINAGVLAMVAGLVIVPIVSLCTKVSDKDKVSGMFECYNRTVTVKASTALGDKESD